MNLLTIEEIAKACQGTAIGSANIDSVVIDSRKVKKDCLFIAIKGENFDGHDFIESVEKSGAKAIMCHKKVDSNLPTIMVRDTREAMLDLAHYYRNLFDIPVIGLTGSVGKTTTKEMTCAVLSTEYKTLKTQGNLNNDIGLPLTIFGFDDTYNAAVIEMGMNHFGEISRLSKTASPTVGLITNIGVSHIENLGSRENILKAKLELLDGLEKGAPLILNGDNDLLSTVKSDDYKVVFYGIDNPNCQVRAYDITAIDSYTKFKLSYNDREFMIRIPTMGIHNVYNALAAITTGIELKIPIEKAAQALLEYTPAGMRQRINKINGITFIEDCYNSSPDSVKAASMTLAEIKGKRKIAVIGDMLELGEISQQSHRDIGEMIAQSKTDILLTYGELSRFTAMAAYENGLKNTECFDDKEELASRLKSILKEDDIVLFKASRGMKLEDVIQSVYESIEKY